MTDCEFRVFEDGKPLCQNKVDFSLHDYDCENCIEDDL